MKTTTGFTLIELLISITVIMLVGSLITSIFFSALRGTERTQSIISLRQKGNFALSQMVKSIRGAESITNIDACSVSKTTDLTIVSSLDHEQTTYSCTTQNIASSSGTSSAYLLDSTEGITLTSCSFSCGLKAPFNTPYATVTFSLAPTSRKDSALSGVSQQFSTTVFLRNSPD